jgi:hypothetical protein
MLNQQEKDELNFYIKEMLADSTKLKLKAPKLGNMARYTYIGDNAIEGTYELIAKFNGALKGKLKIILKNVTKIDYNHLGNVVVYTQWSIGTGLPIAESVYPIARTKNLRYSRNMLEHSDADVSFIERGAKESKESRRDLINCFKPVLDKLNITTPLQLIYLTMGENEDSVIYLISDGISANKLVFTNPHNVEDKKLYRNYVPSYDIVKNWKISGDDEAISMYEKWIDAYAK